MNITSKSSKDDIITSSLEIVDNQALKINQLQQQQIVLFAIIGALTIYSLFWITKGALLAPYFFSLLSTDYHAFLLLFYQRLCVYIGR